MADTVLAVLDVQLASGGSDRLALTSAPVTLGRSPDNDIVLDDPQVSGRHARITLAGGSATLMDLGSLNGTWLNGQRIPPRTPMPLSSAATVQIDEYTMRLAAPNPQDPPLCVPPVRLKSTAVPGIVACFAGECRKFALDKPVMTIGRLPENDIVIPSSLVSRRHATISVQDGMYTIMDAGGRNGLTVAGKRVQQHSFADGDVVYLGGGEVPVQFRRSIGFVPLTATPPPPRMIGIDLKGRDTVTVGRSKDNDIVLEHPSVSRHHALIERVGKRYRIRDLKSSNGVFVAGRRVERETWIKEGDEIRIASVRLQLREDGLEQLAEEGLRLDAMGLQKWVSRDKNLLQDISLSIYPQEFVALVGMSGSGKSTLMDAINGFRPATHGQVTVNGIDLYRNFDLFRNEMGYVPQRDIVHQELTVYSALNYAARLRMPSDTTTRERHQRITEVLKDLDLADRKDLLISKLSGGQVKRVSIGVELLTKPRLFFLDEPTSGLDPGTEFEMMLLLRKLADQGRTIMLITHATKNVMLCDKVIFLARGGYLAFYGPPDEALPYFDEYRTPEERQQRDIEFDDIYRVLDDEQLGSGKDWDERYRASEQYRQNVLDRLRTAQEQAPAAAPSATTPGRSRPRGDILRQFLILSARNLDIIVQDRFGLALMLAIAPLIGMMDFIWGPDLFARDVGDATKIITMLFMAALISILVGAMASVREIVKELDIYKRERAVTLKLSSYILSKIWVGVILSLYQAVVLVLFLYLFALNNSGMTAPQYLAFVMTMFMGTLSGYLMGLLISAAAPNQNVALLLVIVVLVPQFLFAGALLPLDIIPGGELISTAASTRWAFEAMVNASGIGTDIVEDPCWAYVAANHKQPSDISDAQKVAAGCKCMGAAVFDECNFPGIRNPEFYTQSAQAALRAPGPQQPPKPTSLPSPTAYATLTPYPTFTPAPTPQDPRQLAAYQEQQRLASEEYAARREEQRDEYQDLRLQQSLAYAVEMQQQGEQYAQAMRRYGDDREAWQRDREKAISAAEGTIKAIVDNYGRAFRGTLMSRWLPMGIIMLFVSMGVFAFQKRKDAI